MKNTLIEIDYRVSDAKEKTNKLSKMKHREI